MLVKKRDTSLPWSASLAISSADSGLRGLRVFFMGALGRSKEGSGALFGLPGPGRRLPSTLNGMPKSFVVKGAHLLGRFLAPRSLV
jgi:hypothetical protein